MRKYNRVLKPILCPWCKLPMDRNPAKNAVSHVDGIVICSECAMIESLEKFRPDMAYGLKVAQKRAQAALYGLDFCGEPKLPK